MKFTKNQFNLLLMFGALLPLGIGTTIWFGYYAAQAKSVTDAYVHVETEEEGYCHGLVDTFREDRRLFCYNESIAEILSYKYPKYSPEDDCAHTPLFDAADFAQGQKKDERCKAIINVDNLDPRNLGAKDM